MTAPPGSDPPAGQPRRLATGSFAVSQPGTNVPRRIPTPWIDCPSCSWRHYPAADLGVWHIATTCESCGAPLAAVAGDPSGPAA